MCRIKLLHRQFRCTIYFAFFFLVCSSALFALGKKEEEKRESVNNEFILCITAFDVSELPPGQQILGSVLQRELVLDFGRIHHRVRNSDEISRYEEFAIIAASHQAAAALAAKRAERDTLLFQGTANWKYKKEIKRIDHELRELEATYKTAEKERPFIADKPLFIISEQNTKGSFPVPPGRGGEEAFLRTNNADAFLEGKFRIVYGRIFAEFRLFTRGASFIYEDETIFSQEDVNTAADELKSRFLTALVNSPPAQLRLTAEPDDAQLEVNGRLVKSGDTVELAPGPVTVRASAENYQSIEKEMELEGGDSEEIALVLKPFIMEMLGINLGRPGDSFYMGAMYLGGNIITARTEEGDTVEAADEIDKAADEKETTNGTQTHSIGDENGHDFPQAEIQQRFFSVYVPIGQYRYIRVETDDGLTGEVIVKGVFGDDVRIITLKPRKLPGKDDKPVEDKRREFYSAYGRFWVALPVAFFTYGLNQLYGYSYNISIGSWIAAGVFLAETLIRMGIYVHAASKESIPLWE
ncbi:MAG: hypothetical protein FWG07_04800 [Treponema sp.]|nr:hypothetical protein [Treponema sp.]